MQSSGRAAASDPVRLFRVDLYVTAELLRVATGMAAISGLYYAVALVVDPAYRDELVGTAHRRAAGDLRPHATSTCAW